MAASGSLGDISKQPLVAVPPRPNVPSLKPPTYDRYLPMHSCDLEFVFDAPLARVRSAFEATITDRRLKAATLYRLREFETSGDSSDNQGVIHYMRVSPAGFRDVGSYTFVESGDSTIVRARAFSADMHLWTVFSACSPPVAAFFCCCGLFPAKDWGQNQLTVEELNGLTGIPHRFRGPG